MASPAAPFPKAYPLGVEWVYLTIVEEPHVDVSWRGWVPVAKAQDAQGQTGWLYLSAFSLYKALREEWDRRGRKFQGMAFWARKEAVGRKYARFEISWTKPDAPSS